MLDPSQSMSRREFLATSAVFGCAFAIRPFKAFGNEMQPRNGGRLRIQMGVRQIGDPRLFDWSDMANIVRQSLEYLVRWNHDGTFTPWLLESWEVNADATQYKLKARQGVTWSNGDPFEAEDIAFNIRRWCEVTDSNSMRSRMSALIDADTGQIRGDVIDIIDPHTLTLTLPRPDITLIPSMADYPAAIIHPSFEGASDFSGVTSIGTGPFELEELRVGEYARAVRRPNWWGGRVHLETIEWFDFGTDPLAWISSFETGEIDLVYETPGDQRATFWALDARESRIMTSSTIVARFNTEEAPYSDRRVRKALQLCCDNAAITALGIDGEGTVGENHHVAPSQPEYAKLPRQVRDIEEAQRLMREAGVGKQEFELISLDTNWRKLTGDVIASQIRDAGFSVKRTVLPGSTFWNDWAEYPFSVTDWAGRPFAVQMMALAYRSGEPWNETKFSNYEFDELLNLALSQADTNERRKSMRRMQQILQDEAIMIQPYWRRLYCHHKPWVNGYQMHQAFEQHLEDVWIG